MKSSRTYHERITKSSQNSVESMQIEFCLSFSNCSSFFCCASFCFFFAIFCCSFSHPSRTRDFAWSRRRIPAIVTHQNRHHSHHLWLTDARSSRSNNTTITATRQGKQRKSKSRSLGPEARRGISRFANKLSVVNNRDSGIVSLKLIRFWTIPFAHSATICLSLHFILIWIHNLI